MYKISATEKLSVEPKNIKAFSKKKVFEGTEVTKDILEQGEKIGSIKQLNLTLPKNLRAISFTDYEIKSIVIRFSKHHTVEKRVPFAHAHWLGRL